MRIISLFLFGAFAVNASVLAPTHIKKHNDNCQEILKKQENRYDIPVNLLSAIAQVESKTHPWAVNAQGKSRFFKTKEEAVRHVEGLRKKKVKNIGVGCMQINLSAHKFASIEKAFDPEQNISYGAKLIRSLFDQYGDWDVAIRYYHTANPKYNHAYKARVYRVWNGITVTKAPPTDRLKVGFGPGVGIGNKIS